VLRLEERLGFVHKGIEKRFEAMAAATGHRLAGRVSGDSTVAYAWAYAQALEAIDGDRPAARAWLRALALERERIANHLGDLGYLGNDGGFAFGLAQFSRLQGGRAAHNLARLRPSARDGLRRARRRRARLPPGCDGRRSTNARAGARDRVLRDIYDEHDGLQDRFALCGIVDPELAAKLGLTGSRAARAARPRSALRFPAAPTTRSACARVAQAGDVAARVAVRFDEIGESLRLVRAIVDAPAGGRRARRASRARRIARAGLVEGWRGPVLVALEVRPDGTIRRCHPHDPSWRTGRCSSTR
jgi:Ni,Fe-hydrogenase III large subunit